MVDLQHSRNDKFEEQGRTTTLRWVSRAPRFHSHMGGYQKKRSCEMKYLPFGSLVILEMYSTSYMCLKDAL